MDAQASPWVCIWSATGVSEFDLCLVLYLLYLSGPWNGMIKITHTV